MTPSEIVVGLDLGATQVRALVGEVTDDQLQFLGLGVAPARGMRRGGVVDLAVTVHAIRSAISRAEEAARVEIHNVIVGVSGEHISSQNLRGTLILDPPREITEGHVTAARHAARPTNPEPGRQIIHDLPRDYILNGVPGVRHPMGMSGEVLEVETHLITGSIPALENIHKCVERTHRDVETMVLSPLAAGLAVISDEEHSLGVLLIDIGASTTEVAIFGPEGLAHSAVIPLGGLDVTDDIKIGFRVPDEKAEEFKLRCGAARPDDVPEGEFIQVHPIGMVEPMEVPRRLVAEIVGPRMDEIFHAVRDEMDKAVAAGIFPASVVITGGTALLPGVTDLAQDILEIPARMGRPRFIEGAVEGLDSPLMATAVGLVHFGALRAGGGSRRHRPSPSWPAATFDRLARWFHAMSRR